MPNVIKFGGGGGLKEMRGDFLMTNASYSSQHTTYSATIDTGSASAKAHYHIGAYQLGNARQSTGIEGSNNGTSWSAIDSVQSSGSQYGTGTKVGETTGYRYYRFAMTTQSYQGTYSWTIAW